MIEKMTQETVNSLTELFVADLEIGQPRLMIEGHVSKKYALQLMRNYQANIKEFSPEVASESQVAYQELSALTDQEFEILYQELATITV